LEGSTNQNYTDFKVLPIESVYKNIVLSWVGKNRKTWFNTKTYTNKRQHGALNAA